VLIHFLVMQNKIFVGNLPWSVTSAQLQEAFAQYGQITDASVVLDKESGRSRGFGFVTFATDAEAQAAVDGMNGTSMDGRDITVNIARAKE